MSAPRIAWCSACTHASDLLFAPPEPLRPEIPCPAISEWLMRSVLLRAPYDVELWLERGPDGAYGLRWGERGPRNFVYESFALAAPQLWPAPDTPIVLWDLRNLFLADGPVVLETSAPFLHRECTRWPGSLVPQRVRIDREAKPLAWPLAWQDTDQPLRLARGEAIAYARFITPDFDPVARVEPIPYSEAIAQTLAEGRAPSLALFPEVA